MLGPQRPPTPYTVGLNIVDSKTINGLGSVSYTSQVSVMANGAPTVISSYYDVSDTSGEGYYYLESGLPYYQETYQI